MLSPQNTMVLNMGTFIEVPLILQKFEMVTKAQRQNQSLHDWILAKVCFKLTQE